MMYAGDVHADDKMCMRQAMHGLIAMEELRLHLEMKEKNLELIGLERLLVGDKAAVAVCRGTWAPRVVAVS